MGEQIEFPKNFNMYMSKVMACLRKGNIEEAIHYMKKAYAIKEEASLNMLLVSSLLQTGHYHEAYELADEKKEFYESDEKRLLIFVEVLLENKQILQAEKYISKSLQSPVIQYRDSWERLEARIDQLKHQQDEAKKEAENKTVRDLYSLASLNTLEQFSKIEEIYALPNSKLDEAAPAVFTNPFVHPLVRATMLSLLAERGLDKTYDFRWFDEIKEVDPISILPLEENPRTVELFDIMNDKLSQNPSLFQLVKNEIDTVLLILYPFEEEVIEEGTAEAWVDAIVQQIEPDFRVLENVDTSILHSINQWITKIHSELLRFE